MSDDILQLPRHEQLQARLNPLREQLIHHILYQSLRNEQAVRSFMEAHVFAVWDFQSLMKALQRKLTCVDIPWVPTIDPDARRLINEIVLDEESDTAPGGGYLSHFELYLLAMQQCGADTNPINTFIKHISAGIPVMEALHNQPLPAGVQAFVSSTMEVVQSGAIHRIAAAFAYGREAIIPSMFRLLVARFADNSPSEWSTLRYYLERHIETDSERHGPLAGLLVTKLCGNDDKLWAEATATALDALTARVQFWESIANSLTGKL